MADENHTQAHQEIDLLLPWYVNDTLEPGEHDRVAKHVASCAACRQNVAMLAEVRESVVRNKATPIVPRPRVDDLMGAVDARRRSVRLDGRQGRTLAAAAAITAVLIGVPLLPDRGETPYVPRQFETATSTRDAPAMDYVLDIRFSAGTLQMDRDRFFQDVGARDVSGSDEGPYRVTVRLSAVSLEDLERFTNGLESVPGVESVSVLALQLPMKSEQ